MAIETSTLKRIIQEQETNRRAKMKKERIIEREIGMDSVRNALRFPNVLVILGIRRCGKSVFSWLSLSGKKFGYINFDDETLYGMEAKELNTIIKIFYELYGDAEFLVFDEIQNINGWELFITRLRESEKVIITGSNSQLLSGELATHLTGRHLDITLFPFSFREFLLYKNADIGNDYTTQTASKAEVMTEEYMKLGGMPEVYRYGTEITKSIFMDIVTKDVIKRHSIRNIKAIEELAKYLLANIGSEISYSKLRNILNIKEVITVKKYVKYLSDAYLILIVERFSFKLKVSIIAPKKIYSMDHGIASSINTELLDNKGRLMENIVAVELIRRKWYYDRDIEIYYWKNHVQEEVDFVIKKGSKVVHLIQVCYEMKDSKTKEREIRGLVAASEDLYCNNLQIITFGDEGTETINGKRIVVIPLWKWLLSKDTYWERSESAKR